jgi:hypothetical protein
VDLAGAGPVATGMNLLLPSPSRLLRQRSLSSTGLVSPKLPRGMLPALPGEPAIVSPGHAHREVRPPSVHHDVCRNTFVVACIGAARAELTHSLGWWGYTTLGRQLDDLGAIFMQPPPPLLRDPPTARVCSTTTVPDASRGAPVSAAGSSTRRTPSGRLVRTYTGGQTHHAVIANTHRCAL